MGYKIETNIEIPPKRVVTGNGFNRKYPFNEMGVGESFFVSWEKLIEAHGGQDQRTLQARICSAAAMYAYRHNVRFTTRSSDDGVRVWRVE